MAIDWKIGFEVELLAPRGRSRLDLARRVAGRRGGRVRRFLHPQSEPSEVAGQPTFETLTPGFEAVDGDGRPLARFVDDITLQAGLERRAPPVPGWYRIVTDDGRLVRLMLRQCSPDAPLGDVLDPIAALFGTPVERPASGMTKVSDDRGVSIAIAAPQPGERERACEIVTPPLEREAPEALAFLLGEARAEGFTVPREGATHVHFDAAPLKSARAIARLVAVFARHGEAFKRRVGTNPHCIRLGPWPEALETLVRSERFLGLGWPDARRALAGVGLHKFCDFNLLNIASGSTVKPTFEVRVLPATLDADAILAATTLFSTVLHWCVRPDGSDVTPPNDFEKLLAFL